MMAVILRLGKVELPHLTLPRIPTMTTKPTMSLDELAEKGADTDLLREMIQFVAQRMMEMDAESLCAAAYGERSPDRANSRNGYRERLWETRSGSVDLKIPTTQKLTRQSIVVNIQGDVYKSNPRRDTIFYRAAMPFFPYQ
jgi:hypothetical protein